MLIRLFSKGTYEAYEKDAVFKDPVGIAEGVESIEAQFNGLAKVIRTCCRRRASSVQNLFVL